MSTWVRAATISVIAACGPATMPAIESSGGGARVAIVAPNVPVAEFGVQPAELADHEVFARIRHRARVARIGAATFALDGPRIDERQAPTTHAELPIYPVIGESGAHVRVVVEGDNARLAIWIPRGDAQPTALAPVRLGDAHGRADAASGVTIGAGASLAAQPAANGLREIKLIDQFVDATGFAPASAIGEVWVAGEHEVYDPKDEVYDPAPTHTGVEIAAGAIRDAPRDAAAVVATAKEPLAARIVSELGSWDEIEVHAKRVRVHGFVPAATVTKDAPERGYGGIGHGGGYGISDTIKVPVPAGACLYDKPNGEIIGAETLAMDRYGGGVENGYWHVYVYTDWGILTVVVHDVSQATDPNAASWETCTK